MMVFRIAEEAQKKTHFMKSFEAVGKSCGGTVGGASVLASWLISSLAPPKRSLLHKIMWLAVWITVAGLPAIPRTEAATNVVVWDTLAHFADKVDIADKAGWKLVPTDLLTTTLV